MNVLMFLSQRTSVCTSCICLNDDLDGQALKNITQEVLKDDMELRVKPRNQVIRCRDALFK